VHRYIYIFLYVLLVFTNGCPYGKDFIQRPSDRAGTLSRGWEGRRAKVKPQVFSFTSRNNEVILGLN